MPSPFPGMDPYLESSQHWHGFHLSMIVVMAEVLQPLLRPKYVATIKHRIQMEDTERKVCFIVIIEAASKEVITVIEMLRPAGKSGDFCGQYLKRQETLLQTDANLVEIDLLSNGRNTVLARHVSEIVPENWRYIISVNRAIKRDKIEYYAFTLKERLPRCKIPLRAPDPDVVLDLPTVFNRCYDAGAYDLLSDYGQLPDDAVLSKDEREWMKTVLTTVEG